MKFNKTGTQLVFAGAAALASMPAAAQLEEIVVTARKKAESMQLAPVAVSAVSKQTIEAAFLGDATGIAQFAPNVVFDDISAGTPGGGGISIRGISFQDVEKSFDPAVLMYLDGVALGTNTGNAMSLLDIERIEVLRGPQGTLFGKNAVGGVINIHRTDPLLGQLAGKARVLFESASEGSGDDAASFEGVMNIPLGETVAAKLNLAKLEKPAFYENITLNEDEGGSEEERFGVHLLWQATDALRAEVQYNESEMEGTLVPMLNISNDQAVLCTVFGACAASSNEPLSGDRREGAGNLEQDFFLDSTDYQVDVNWEITPNLTGVLIAAHRELEEESFIDFDGSPIEIFHVRRPNEYEQDSLELRFDYDSGDRLSVTGGYYYWQSELSDWVNEADISLFLGLPVDACGFGTVPCALDTAHAESESDSFFFEGEYQFADRWYAILGARYIEETKELTKTSRLPVFGLQTLPPTTGERTDDDVIHRVGLRWEPGDGLMTYATWSTGFRSGGFSIRSVTPEVLTEGFEPETVDNYEIGVKADLLDRRLRVNATLFSMDYENMQLEVQLPRPGGQRNQDAVLNVGESSIQGVELEVSAFLNDYLTLDLNAGWLDAEYEEFTGQIFADGSPTADHTDLPMRRAPEWNYSAALSYDQDLGNGRLLGRLSYTWTDDYAGTVTDFPGTHIDEFGLLDASLSYMVENWKIGAFGRNLTNEDEYSHTFVVVPQTTGGSLFTFATPRPPRTYGLEVSYTFGNY